MKQKVSDYIADFLVSHGVDTIFTVTGGGAMHMNDALGHHPSLHCIYNHHEQASAIAAEGYTRLSGRPCAVCVTSGPGGTNAITGIFDCWVDSIPLFVLTGQVKRETTIAASSVPLRQLGDQEGNIVAMVSPITKYAHMLDDTQDLRYCLEKAWYLAHHGRKGPVLIDVPLDIQGAQVETEDLRAFDPYVSEENDFLPGHTTGIMQNTSEEDNLQNRDDATQDDTVEDGAAKGVIPTEKRLASALASREEPVYDSSYTGRIVELIKNSRRPVILAGEGIRLGGALEDFLKAVDILKIPVVTAWNAQDLMWEDHPYYYGIPGTVGQRPANFAVQNADLLLVLGCRMNIRIISYNRFQFAQDAYKIQVDIDENELKKPTVKIDLPIHADVKDVCRELSALSEGAAGDHSKWVQFCDELFEDYPVILPQYFQTSRPMNPYAFFGILSRKLTGEDAIVCGNGAACVQTFQALALKQGGRIFTNSGSAAMGFGFPASLGAAVARKGDRVICIDGDGSFMMNLQELQTVVYNHLNLKIIILNNNGYHSIRQTQTNLFKGRPLVGVSKDSGVSFPDFQKLAMAFGLPYIGAESLQSLPEKLDELLESEGPVLFEAFVDQKQNFEPKLSSKVHPDGRITSPPLDDMFPFLPEEEYKSIREKAGQI
ncbi:MAG: thiamine pyrophosphate-binding protein [Lachnospiraceae bacterium]|nr:thiamine pyrophosphate-binding protein [Lachnospiraceae bacterium]